MSSVLFNDFVSILSTRSIVLHAFFMSWRSEKRARNAFDGLVLGFFYMHNPVEYIKESIGKKQWSNLERIWRVVENDYELRKKRDEFLDYLEREQYEGLKAIAEWRAYLKTRTGSNEDIGVT
jgi:hypothetical protein